MDAPRLRPSSRELLVSKQPTTALQMMNDYVLSVNKENLKLSNSELIFGCNRGKYTLSLFSPGRSTKYEKNHTGLVVYCEA